ncbi:hypothetical protein FRC06_000123 [Ceratobasidium sp. 370]|nr:hypothetical protein FRC06_000123 [Ceratobasidium sp. 370]
MSVHNKEVQTPGNLGWAVKRCNLRRGVSDEAETTPSPEFTQAYFRALVVMWCAVNHRPFNAVSDPLFIDIVHLLRPSAHVPCPQTISSDLTRIYNRLSTDVRESFQETETAMHLAIDGWSSPLKASFLALILFWREGGVLWSTTLDFIHLTKAHKGTYMAEKTVECLEHFGVRNQIVSMCLDNARNNDTFTQSIASKLPNLLGSKMRARCVAHIANLIDKAFLDLYTRPASKKRRVSGDNLATPVQPSTAAPSFMPESDASGNDSTESGAPLDAENDVDEAKEMFDQAEVKVAVAKAFEYMKTTYGVVVTAPELREAQELLSKINGFAHDILTSSTLEPMFISLCNSCKQAGSIKTQKTLPSAYVSTRWNSQRDTGKTHLELKTPIEVVTARTDLELKKHRLSPTGWELLEEVCQCLEVLDAMTQMFSQKNTVLIHEALPSMHVVKFRLERMRDDTNNILRPITRVAAYSALLVVNKYLRLMEESDLYLMAVAMCPVRQMLHNFYTQLYGRRTSVPPPPECLYPARPAPPINPWMEVPATMQTAIRAATSHTAPSTGLSAIDTYLAAPVTCKDNKAADGGVFAYWNRQQTEGSLIASMALDILTAPASSVDAEQAFSGGRMAVNYRQHRMSISTFRAKMALGSWYGTPLMPNIDQAVEILTDGSGHTSEEPDLDP